MKSVPTLLLVLLATLSSCAKKPHAAGLTDLEAKVLITKRGEVVVEETITPDLKTRGALTRQIPFQEANNRFLLRQRIARTEVRVGSRTGKRLKHRARAGDYWFNIDFLELPPKGERLWLTYTLYNATSISGTDATLRWSLPGSFWALNTKSMAVTFTFEEPVPSGEVKLTNRYDYLNPLKGTLSHTDRSVTFRSAEGIVKAGAPVDFTLTFPARVTSGSGGAPFMGELFRQARVPILLFIFLVILGIIALFLPARVVINLTMGLNFLFPLAIIATLWPNTLYWWHERAYRPTSDSNPLSSAFINVVFALFFLFFAIVQQRGFKQFKRTAYYLQLSLLPIMFLPILMPGTAMVLFGFLGLPILIYWHRRDIAWQFGAGTGKIVEEVNSRGEATFDDLAAAVNLTPEQLRLILKQNHTLPIIPNFNAGTITSMENAALAASLKVCPQCGGGSTVSVGQSMVECAYCGSNYTAAKERTAALKNQTAGSEKKSGKEARRRRAAKPVPFVVDAIASFSDTLAIAFFFYATLLGVMFTFFEAVDGDGVGAGVVLGGVTFFVLGAIAVGCKVVAEKLRRGELYTFQKVVLIIFSPTIAAIFALRKLSSPLVQIHFERADPKQLETKLKEVGEMKIEVLAQELKTSYSEATDAAAYLAGNNIIAAVYDRVHARLVHRDLYATMAHEDNCASCGGVLGVEEGVVTCQYCGSTYGEGHTA